jgi:hypothetical protein
MSKTYIFFSKSCEHCLELIRNNNLNAYEMVNIHELKTIPQFLVSVPCLYNKSKNVLLFGKDVDKYVKQMYEQGNKYYITSYDSDIKNPSNGYSLINSQDSYYTEQDNFKFLNNF